jgi:FKBP-type peptidyl-prolyl cis-trans isomerase
VGVLKLNRIFFITLSVFLIACNSESPSGGKVPEKKAAESLLKTNHYLVKQEKEEIENYIRRHGWQMQETGSGLRYEIVSKGTGEQAVKGNVAVLDYTCRLITGDIVYSSQKDGAKTFVIGHGGVESGLEEAVLLLHRGDKARLVIPSHLAFGLLGDDNKIPPRATLIYEIELIDLK